MKILKAEDGSGMILVNDKGDKMQLSFMEFWEICRTGDQMDVLSEVEEYLNGLVEDYIAGYEIEAVLDNPKMLSLITKEVMELRMANETGDQIWDATQKVVKEFIMNPIQLNLHEYIGNETEPARTICFTVCAGDLRDHLAFQQVEKSMEEFLKSYTNDEAKVLYENLTNYRNILVEETIYCDEFETDYEEFIKRALLLNPEKRVDEIATKEEFFATVYFPLHEKESKIKEVKKVHEKTDDIPTDKPVMTHNEYQEFLKAAASRVHTDKNYTLEDFDRDTENVIIKDFELDNFKLSEKMKKTINKWFDSERLSKFGNLLLEGMTRDSWHYTLARELDCELVCDDGARSFFKNEGSRLILEYCEGDSYLILCETEKDYKKELADYENFYGVKSIVKKANEENELNKKLVLEMIEGYPSTFVFIDDMDDAKTRYNLGMVCANGAAIYINEAAKSLIRGFDIGFNEELDENGDYIVEGEYALNGLYFMYAVDGKIGNAEFSMMIEENPAFISEEMKERLLDICQRMEYEVEHLSDLKSVQKGAKDLDKLIDQAANTCKKEEDEKYKGYVLQRKDGISYPFKARPYDEASYMYAKSEDEIHWTIGFKGKKHMDFTGTFKEVVDELEFFNKNICPQIKHL